ncbi:MAG TPA: peptide ABC transporter substrate-binding protein [Kofleriaceae bacterium]|nr:peptide ABC transporter substrate-binding protein [Kofleriaceae bacterium]
MARSAVLVLGALVGCSLPAGDYFGRVPDGPGQIDPTHVRWCSQGEPDHLDPTLASSTVSSQLVATLFDGLTVYGRDGLPVPGLATHWEIAGDLRTFTFHLRRDARWSNGRAVTAYDVAHSALRVAHPRTASPNADTLAPIKGATAYLTRRVFVMRRAVGGLAPGDVVELVGESGAEIDARTASRPLALRDLGAPVNAAYAVVPPGARVAWMMTTGGRATLPSPDGTPWAYVLWARDLEGVGGWVSAHELDGEPDGDHVLRVRRAAPKDLPSWTLRTIDATHDTPTRGEDRPVEVRASDLVVSTDAIGIAVPDPYTIVFETADPTPYFLSLTTNRGLRATPIEAWSRWPRHWDRPEHIVTSGPFHLVAWKERDRVELVRSPTYWDRGAVRIERFTSLSIDDQGAATSSYFTGACDATAANVIPSTYLPAINGEQRGGRAYKDYDVSPFLTVYFAWIQTRKLPDRHLRRALSLAIDRSAVPRFTHGGEIPTAQLTPGTPIAQLSDADLAACGVARTTPGVALVMVSGELCYVPPPGLDHDPEAARREIALARAEGGVPDQPIEYRYNAGSEVHKQIGEYLQSAWARIGVPVRLAAQEWNSLLDDTHKGDFEISRLGAAGTLADTESEFLSIFRCDSPDNRGRYCSPAFERLMDEARTLTDRKARNAKLREAEAVMLEDAPVLPIYVYTQKHLVKPYVRDYAFNVIDQPPLWRIWLDASWRPR